MQILVTIEKRQEILGNPRSERRTRADAVLGAERSAVAAVTGRAFWSVFGGSQNLLQSGPWIPLYQIYKYGSNVVPYFGFKCKPLIAMIFLGFYQEARTS